MESTRVLLILIGILVIYVIYQQLRLNSTPKPTIMIMQQPTDGEAGCGAATLVIVAIITGMMYAVLTR